MRLFVAVNLPSDVRQTLWDAAAPLRASSLPVRWVRAEAIHLTMKFLGDVPDAREAEIIGGLQSAVVSAKAFSVEVAGWGAFPNLRRPQVVWIGVEATPPLEILQHRVEREMHQLGFPLEGRPFHPHLTLGRVRKHARPQDVPNLEAMLSDLSCHATVTVQSLDLMESTLRPDGAEYAVRHAATLDG